jgi:hypothetical protein
MTYPEFVQELIKRFGNDAGTLMALRAEVGFLRKYLEAKDGEQFITQQESMIEDFLKRHPSLH